MTDVWLRFLLLLTNDKVSKAVICSLIIWTSFGRWGTRRPYRIIQGRGKVGPRGQIDSDHL